MWTPALGRLEEVMTLTIAEFRKLMSLYQNDFLSQRKI